MNTNRKYLIPFILVTSLFFLWAFLHNINPILIPHLKKACQLTDTQSAFIDTSIYFAYFLIALPAGWFMHRFGYRKAIIFGLLLFGCGFLLFIPASMVRSYSFFLVALFVGAAGATFLETVANPYITKLGDEKSAAQRLNFAQSFNGVGAFLAPIIGGAMILSGIEYSSEELAAMDKGKLNEYLAMEASSVRIPYLVIGIVVFVLLFLFILTKIPEVTEEGKKEKSSFSLKVFRHKHFRWAVIAQLFYIGAQVGAGSFIIRFSKFTADIPEKQAAFWWGSIAMVGFMIGRFAGTFFMRYISAARLLAIYSAISFLLMLITVLAQGIIAVYTLMAVPFFMSIMFPTIFALGIRGLGEETKIASSFIVMSIVGGALFPLLMGGISDMTGGNIQLSYLVPMLCFVVVFVFAFQQLKNNNSGDPVLTVNH